MKRSLVLATIACATAHPHGGTGPSTAPTSSSSTPVSTVKARLDLERGAAPAEGQAAPLLLAMQAENAREMGELGKNTSPAPYFLGYEVTDTSSVHVSGSFGALDSTGESHNRVLDVDVRVGDRKLDSTHGGHGGLRNGITIPLDDDPKAIATELWLVTEREYRNAAESYANIVSDQKTRAEEEDKSGDFSVEKPEKLIEPPVSAHADREAIAKKVREWSALFKSYPELQASSVSYDVTATQTYQTNSEGSLVQQGNLHARIFVAAYAMADDGMNLHREEWFDAASPDGLPDDDTVKKTIAKVATDVIALRHAPLAEPFAGPAILDGRAAGVFFHEVFGHRVEGHRQKNENEGQTFSKKIGQAIMPSFVDVYDDPTIAKLNGVDLNGHYDVDDEAVPAQRASLVEGGVLKTFLLGRGRRAASCSRTAMADGRPRTTSSRGRGISSSRRRSRSRRTRSSSSSSRR
jgi:hypothetical protein